eukprot:3687453-Amphidinium_carterae.3
MERPFPESPIHKWKNWCFSSNWCVQTKHNSEFQGGLPVQWGDRPGVLELPKSSRLPQQSVSRCYQTSFSVASQSRLSGKSNKTFNSARMWMHKIIWVVRLNIMSLTPVATSKVAGLLACGGTWLEGAPENNANAQDT